MKCFGSRCKSFLVSGHVALESFLHATLILFSGLNKQNL